MANTTVYLAQLNVFGAELTAVGRTEDEARGAIKTTYECTQDRHGPLDEDGNMRTFDDYADFASMVITAMPFEWLS